jgi:homospermidine synthase
VHFSGD